MYKTNKLKQICSDYSIAKKNFGEDMADKISQRISELQSADSVEMLVKYSVGRCHPLKGNRLGQYAMDLVHPHRLVFEHDGYILELVKIISIEDYH